MKKSQVLMVMSAVMLAPHLQWYMGVALALFWCFLSYCSAKVGD